MSVVLLLPAARLGALLCSFGQAGLEAPEVTLPWPFCHASLVPVIVMG